MSVDFGTIHNATALLQSVNSQTNGYFWLMMLIMVYAVLILAGLSYGFEISMLSATLIILMATTFMAYADFVAWSYVLMFLAIFLGMIIYIYVSSYRENS